MNRNFLNYPQHLFTTYVFPFQGHVITPAKNANIETLRGIAIILVVFGHIIGSTNTGGMRVADDSIFRYLYFTLEYIRMPLFTVISGWVYANKPVVLSHRKKFLSGKLRRLILPMFVLSTLLFLFRMVIPGTNTTPVVTDLPKNLIFPYDLYWYLYSLFLIFITITILDTRPFFHTMKGWLAAITTAFIVLWLTKIYLEDVPNFFSFKGATYLFPFFLIGIAIRRYRSEIFQHKLPLIYIMIFGVALVIQQAVWFGILPHQTRESLLGLTVGITGVLLLFNLGIKNKFLIWIGSYAYSIFLFHVFFTGGTRIIFLKIGIENKWIILFCGLILSLWIPIIIDTLINRFTVLRFCFLGLKKNDR
jgi:glucans biosynthesis protein C